MRGSNLVGVRAPGATRSSLRTVLSHTCRHTLFNQPHWFLACGTLVVSVAGDSAWSEDCAVGIRAFPAASAYFQIPHCTQVSPTCQVFTASLSAHLRSSEWFWAPSPRARAAPRSFSSAPSAAKLLQLSFSQAHTHAWSPARGLVGLGCPGFAGRAQYRLHQRQPPPRATT